MSHVGERGGGIVRHAETGDASSIALVLEPVDVRCPRLQIVDLLDLDASEPGKLSTELLAARLNGGRPDLRRDDGPVTAVCQQRGERRLGPAVHGRRVDEPATGVQGGADNLARESGVPIEGVPRSEPNNRAEPALFHQTRRLRARRPAAKADAKKSESSSGPRPMCDSGRPEQSSRQSVTSISSRGSSQSGATHPEGQATATSPRQSSRTARVW